MALDRIIICTAALLACAEPVIGQCPHTVLADPSGNAGDLMGNSVAVAHPYLVVAARWDDGAGFKAGTLLTFEFDSISEQWVPTGELTGSVTSDSDSFGYCIDMSTEWLAVGAVGDDNGSFLSTGSVTLFQRSGTDWNEHTVLYPPSANENYISFGFDLDLEGEHLLVGSSKRGANLYIYDEVTDTWSHRQTLAPLISPATAGDEVALGGGLALVSNHYTKVPPFNQTGTVHVFEWDSVSGTYIEGPYLMSPDGPFIGDFGTEFATDGETILVSVRNSSLATGGPIYVYQRRAAGAPWKITQRLLVNDSGSFGQTEIEVYGDWVVASSFEVDQVHMYQRDPLSGEYHLERVVSGSELGVGLSDSLTFDLAMDGRWIVGGAPLAANQGRSIVWDTSKCNMVGNAYCDPAVANSTGDSGRAFALGLAVAGGHPFEIAGTQLPQGQVALLLASRFKSLVTPPGSDGVLCLGPPIARFGTVGVIDAGQVWFEVDTTSIPLQPPVAVQPGETWNFQIWNRDSTGGGSNFTAGVEVLFQ